MTYCPDCGEPNEHGEKEKFGKGKYDEALPDVEIINIILLCPKCKFGWNCVGTRKVK